jgi:cyanate permease|tara:strand:- start:16 stop:417 length:402 start_codon:yes stop_codon:yes gene_type:complete
MKYIIKIWLFTIIISPLLIALVLGAIINNSSFNSILNSYEIIFIMIIVGFLSSIPAMIIFWLIKRGIKSKFTNWKEKLILSIYSFLSVWTTFYIVDNGFITRWSEQTIWVLIYSLTIVIGVWIFKIPKGEIIK